MLNFIDIKNKNKKIAVIGLGYVGMPIAIEFAKYVSVIGFDINEKKIQLFRKGIDPTNEVGGDAILKSEIELTSNPEKLKEASFYIVAVPTPVNDDHTPDLSPVEAASRILGKNLSKGSVVVYESTVYPGVTEEICVPILERESGLLCGFDFKIGYSPERINPGDKVHRLDSIVKIVSGMDSETCNLVADVYGLVVKAGVYKANSIKVAEAAKVIENSQRDINIAFMNELSIIFHIMGIDTKDVLKAAGTKWNFMDFYPGLVGGHCIGVDPYYLTYKAEKIGYHSQVILAGRRINDSMGKYIAENLVKVLIKMDIPVKNSKVAILGLTFKENCPDIRNTKVMDIYNELLEYGITPAVVDPYADIDEAKKNYGISIRNIQEIRNLDAIIFAVSHDIFVKYELNELKKFFGNKSRILFDVKGIFDKTLCEKEFVYWRL